MGPGSYQQLHARATVSQEFVSCMVDHGHRKPFSIEHALNCPTGGFSCITYPDNCFRFASVFINDDTTTDIKVSKEI